LSWLNTGIAEHVFLHRVLLTLNLHYQLLITNYNLFTSSARHKLRGADHLPRSFIGGARFRHSVTATPFILSGLPISQPLACQLIHSAQCCSPTSWNASRLSTGGDT